jgi:Flp pilus assembly protein CpaB
VRGRAVVGGLLVTLSLLGVTQAYADAERTPATRYVVAVRPIVTGETITTASVELVGADLPPAIADRAFTSAAPLEGTIALAPLQPGDLLLLTHVLPAGADRPDGVEISFAISADRAVGGSLQPGEPVDLVASYPSGPRARVVARAALLVDVADTSDSLLTDGRGLVLTVRVGRRAEVLEVVQAVDQGQLTVVRGEAEDAS